MLAAEDVEVTVMVDLSKPVKAQEEMIERLSVPRNASRAALVAL